MKKKLLATVLLSTTLLPYITSVSADNKKDTSVKEGEQIKSNDVLNENDYKNNTENYKNSEGKEYFELPKSQIENQLKFVRKENILHQDKVNIKDVNIDTKISNKVDTPSPYAETKELLENSTKSVTIPQDYLIIYDYYGMNSEAKETGWRIIKALAASVADGSRFMLHLTTSQLPNHANLGNGALTTVLLSKSELLNMTSPTELSNKATSGSGTFYNKYKNELRGNSNHDISALYIFDNWTLQDPKDPNSTKEEYDQGFINYLKENNAKTVMAVGLFDKDPNQESLVESQSKAIGFNNYYINSNPDLSTVIQQYLATSKAFVKNENSYDVTIKSQEGVKLINPRFIVNDKEYKMTLSDDGLSATLHYDQKENGKPSGQIKYETEDNKSSKDVTITSSIKASNGTTIEYPTKTIPAIKKGNLSYKIVDENNNIIKSQVIKENLTVGSKFSTTSNLPKYITDDKYIYELTSQNNLEGEIKENDNIILMQYKKVLGSLSINFFNNQKEKITNNNTVINNQESVDYKLPDSLLFNKINYFRDNAPKSINEDLKTKDVSYELYYSKHYSSVKNIFTDSNDTPIQHSKITINNQLINTEFNVENEIPETITLDNGRVFKLNKEKSDKPKGITKENGTIIKSKYSEIVSNVHIKFIANENEIKDMITPIKNANVNSSYNLSKLIPKKIVTNDKKVYLLEDNQDFSGKTSKTDKTINARYKELKKKVSVSYTSSSKYKLKDNQDINKLFSIGEKTKANDLAIKVITDEKYGRFALDENSNKEITVSETNDNIINLIYKPVLAKLTIKHVDENGNNISDDVKFDNIQVDSNFNLNKYAMNKILFNNKEYELVKEKSPNYSDLKKKDSDEVVTYVYKEIIKPKELPKTGDKTQFYTGLGLSIGTILIGSILYTNKKKKDLD